ncbi:serine hydrolase domain-containing protein [Agromyces sp. ZXT2-6]|uniref:serine hydrolase domain-containing protein n=1 Tax=Agromyces sp. ZXT2-6 TaxID=3461153 RepID=UPI004054F3F2
MAAVVLALATTAALAGCTPGAVAGSPGPAASPNAGSDEELLRAIRPTFTDPDDRAAVAVVEGDDVRVAFVGADDDTAFEIGSVTKTFTGLLLADAVERGEVALDDPIGEYLDLGDAAVASATLGELATHRSGLPTFPSDPEWIAAVEDGFHSGEDVLDETVPELLALARAEPLAPDARPQYSNLGAALTGHALAAAAGTDYPTLLEERILDPLDLDGASLPVEDDEVPASLAPGFLADGRPAEPSTLGAFAPAGGIVATIDDLAAYARAVIDGPFADSAALEPLAEWEGSRIGCFWSLSTGYAGHDVASHGGLTAGFGASLVVDRTAGRAVIVLANSGEPVDALAEDIMIRVSRDDG